MKRRFDLDRRTFLRSAGATAVLGAAGLKPAHGLEPTRGPRSLYAQVFDFDEIYDRVGTNCTKWDGAIQDFGAIDVGMGIADTDFRAAPCITRALAERCAHENWGYLRRPAAYAEAVADWNQRRYALDVDPDDLVWTAGVHPALIAALQTFAPPGSSVLLTSPVYNGFYADLRFTRTVAEDSPMTLVDGNYSIDFDDFERRAERAQVFILCNPQNPTGNCWSPEDLTRMGEICVRHRVVVLADEIHCDFVNEGQSYTPFASLPDRDIVNNSLTFKAASKSFNLAAMKVSWFFSTNRDYLARVRANTRTGLPTLGLIANHAALTEGEPWLDQLGTYIDGNHDFAESYIRDNVPHVKYTKAQGTYLAWIDVSEIVEGIGAERTAAEESLVSAARVAPEDVVQRWLAENAGVFLSPGDNFGTGGAGHMRMNLGTPRHQIRRALDNISEAIAGI
jgi:cysteine-S-conjugate beta-lyase